MGVEATDSIMKTIIAGSRNITDYEIVKQAIILSGISVSEVVSGRARGVDTLGEKYALENNLPIKEFPALWDIWGRSAGYMRNSQMAEYAEALVAVWDGSSRGTAHMISEAKKNKLQVFVHVL